jgi:hypothetical protein
VIFTENQKGWIRNEPVSFGTSLDEEIQRKIKKSILQHETITFINQLVN